MSLVMKADEEDLFYHWSVCVCMWETYSEMVDREKDNMIEQHYFHLVHWFPCHPTILHFPSL